MRVYINTKDTKLYLLIPNALLFNRIVKKIVFSQLSKTIDLKFSEQEEKIIFEVIKRTKKKYKGLRIVDIYTSEHEIIRVTL